MEWLILLALVTFSPAASEPCPAVRENDVKDICMRLYNKTLDNFLNVRLDSAADLLQASNFDMQANSVMYTHGYIETPASESITTMVSAYLEAKSGTNVFLLDWSNMASGDYALNAAPNTEKVGIAWAQQMPKMIAAGLSSSKLHLIGHSLGSHVTGSMARNLETKIPRVTGLDPAGPLFTPLGLHKSLSKTDADFVDIIHTNGAVYGTLASMGTADFWPNCLTPLQPGCPPNALIPLSPDNLCSHWRSWRYYAESVRNANAFIASPADSCLVFSAGFAPKEDHVVMGENCSTNTSGLYFLTTNAASPFGKGSSGS